MSLSPGTWLGNPERMFSEVRPSIRDIAENIVGKSTRTRAKACRYEEMC